MTSVQTKLELLFVVKSPFILILYIANFLNLVWVLEMKFFSDLVKDVKTILVVLIILLQLNNLMILKLLQNDYKNLFNAGWSNLTARLAHNQEVAGLNPAPATNSGLPDKVAGFPLNPA